jgi:hypothetical protein
MNVLTSNFVGDPLFKPSKPPAVCSDQLMYLRNNLGNFYSFADFFTYYHNWYDRRSIRFQTPHDIVDGRKDSPADFICYYRFGFLSHYIVSNLSLSILLNARGPPKILLIHKICFLRSINLFTSLYD